jgi:hypothetical protein
MLEAVSSFETSVSIYQTSRRSIQEDSHHLIIIIIIVTILVA